MLIYVYEINIYVFNSRIDGHREYFCSTKFLLKMGNFLLIGI